MKFPKIVTAALIAASVASVAACGSDDSDVPDVPTVATTTAAATGNNGGGGGGLTDPNTRPTVAELNEMLNKALDGSVPNAQKTQLVEGSSADPKIFDQLVKAKKDNPDVTYKIYPPVIPSGPNKATVKVQVKLPDNPPTKLDASIVFVDGRWKLSRDTVCPLITANNVKTPMCEDTSGGAASKKAPN